MVRGGGNDETVSTGCGSPSVLHPWMLLLHMQETALWIPRGAFCPLEGGAQTHWHQSYTVTISPRRGRTHDAMAKCPYVCVPPPVKMLPQVLHQKFREEKASVLLITPYWSNRPWFPDLLEILTAPPWPILLSRDLLSQADG